MSTSPNLNLAEFIRNIPDFPKPGVLFRDITPLLASPHVFREAIGRMAAPFRQLGIDLVAAAEARGFIFAAPLALELGAGLIPIRKPGKLPFKTLSYTYQLEYGTDTLEVHVDAVRPGSKVLMVDDLLATGGTIEACCRMIEQAGGQVAGCVFLIELAEFGGRKKIAAYNTVSLIRYE